MPLPFAQLFIGFGMRSQDWYPVSPVPKVDKWQQYIAYHVHACVREETQRCRRPIAQTMLGVSCVQLQ